MRFLRQLVSIGVLVLVSSSGLRAELAHVAEDSPAAFAQELERVHYKMGQSEWKAARVQLERALAAHEGQAYVLGQLGEIELILQRCVFWESRGDLDVASLFAGELLAHSGRNDKIKLRYQEDAAHDFEQRGLALVHKVQFSGPYSIEIEASVSPTVVVCIDGSSQVQVSFGRVFNFGKDNPNHGKPTKRWVQVNSRLLDKSGKVVQKEERADFTSRDGLSSATYKVAVTGRTINVYFEGKNVLNFSRPDNLWGSIAIPLGGPKGTILVEGEAANWFKQKRDETFDANWKAFESKWRLRDHLPMWMVAALDAPTAPSAKTTSGKAPSELSQELIAVWNEAVKALGTRDYEVVLSKTKELLTREPDLAQAAFLQSQALFALKEKSQALAVLAPTVKRFPAYADAVEFLSLLYLTSGRFEDVLQTVQAAVQAGMPPSFLQKISITANKGLHGPTWAQKTSYDSRHFRVASDLSAETCRSVAMELEENFRFIGRKLGDGSIDDSRKFQVYVFSGQASYLDYIEDVFGGRGESTQGMYSTYLKQLLVLESEPRERLMHTVRHEGFHQYLDSFLAEPPIWLNEGLAEYFAASRTPQGSWQEGRIHEDRANYFRLGSDRGAKQGLTPLKAFLAIQQAEFMRNGEHNYAQAWAFVHFLQHSSVQNKDRYQRLLQELMQGASNEAAIGRAFAESDLSTLDAEFARYVEKL